MGRLLGDLRYGVRTFLRNPGFMAVALFSLALGIGANTTIFSVFASIAFRSFPVKEPDRLALLSEDNEQQQRGRRPSYATFLELKKQSQVFEDWTLTGLGAGPVTLSALGRAEQGRLSEVGSGFFSVLGVSPILGRSFELNALSREDKQTAVISYGFWQRFFGGDADVLGQTLRVEGFPKTIIGVMPPDFWVFPWAKDADVWCSTLDPRFEFSENPDLRWMTPLGRLRKGVTMEQVRAEMDVISRRLEELDPGANKGWSIQVDGLREWADRGYRETLHLLMGAVAFVLLIACANVANLLLARGASRQKELAVRASVGASRLSLLRQLMTESLVLAVIGGALGVTLSLVGVRIFLAMAPTWLLRGEEVSISCVVLAFTIGISFLAAVLFGLFPALQTSKPDLQNWLKEGGRSTIASGSRSRSILVVAEVALALVLLVGAGLMTNSFLRLQQVDPGLNPENVLVADVFLAGAEYWNYAEDDRKRVTSQGLLFFEQVLERVRALPGVVSAGSAGPAPPGNGWMHNVGIVGQEPPTGGQQLRASYCEVSPEFFETLEIPLLKGRTLYSGDVESSSWVVVINETMAEQFFPNEDPIGKSLRLSMPGWAMEGEVAGGRPREIVGVVGDVKRWSVKWRRVPLMYGSHQQHVWEYPGGQYASHLQKDFVIRTAANPMSLARELQRIVAEVDPDQTIYSTRTMENALSEMLAPERFWMRLYGIFAAIALILAAAGIYGVMSYSVNQRTHEIGVRMAVGAQRRDVMKLVIWQGLKLTVVGLAIGIGASFWLTKFIAGFLYGVSPGDPLTLVVVSMVLVVLAIAACYVPARRATTIDPMVALRYE